MSRAEVPPRQSALRKLQNQPLGLFTASTTTHDNNTHSAHAIRTSQNHNITKDVLALTDTIDQFVSRRFVKKQQMQWTLRGAHLLLQTRTKVLNDELEKTFQQWYPRFLSQAA